MFKYNIIIGAIIASVSAWILYTLLTITVKNINHGIAGTISAFIGGVIGLYLDHKYRKKNVKAN